MLVDERRSCVRQTQHASSSIGIASGTVFESVVATECCQDATCGARSVFPGARGRLSAVANQGHDNPRAVDWLARLLVTGVPRQRAAAILFRMGPVPFLDKTQTTVPHWPENRGRSATGTWV